MLRNLASGRYYGRFTLAGKQKWFNLKTDVCTVAEIRQAGDRARIERVRMGMTNVAGGSATVCEWVAIHADRVEDRTDITQGAKDGLFRAIGAVLRT